MSPIHVFATCPTATSVEICAETLLAPTGLQFRQDLFEFCGDESRHFMAKRASVRDLSHTGTSISGIAPGPAEQYGRHYNESDESNTIHHKDSITFREPFPLRVYTSTMPRAADTVNWEDFTANQKSNLNPLDKGDYAEQYAQVEVATT